MGSETILIAIIARKALQDEIQKALEETSIIYEKYDDELQLVDLELEIKKIRNMDEVDLLILDAGATTNPKDAIVAIKNYRIVRENERILVILPKGQDMSLGENISKFQVYDFVTA